MTRRHIAVTNEQLQNVHDSIGGHDDTLRQLDDRVKQLEVNNLDALLTPVNTVAMFKSPNICRANPAIIPSGAIGRNASHHSNRRP